MSSSAADVLDPEVALEDEFSDSDDELEEEEMAECCSDDGMGMGMGMGIGPVKVKVKVKVKDGEMIERYDKQELLISQQEVDGMDTTVTEPYEGMEFDSEDSARAFYYDYASHTGFRVRVSRCQRSVRDGTIICRRFVCSREGFYMHKGKGNVNVGSTKRQRTVTRVGCMAMLLVRKQSHGRWLVTKFVKEHNHNHDHDHDHDPNPPRKMDLKPPSYVIMKARKLQEKESSASASASLPPQGQGNQDLEPCEGMEFQSVEAAQMFYYAYAKDMGFTVRISKCRRARDGSIICRRFVCSKEGFYVRKYGRTKRSRALTRVGCLARLIVKRLDSGIWVVANFDKEHNHPPFVVGQELSYHPPKPTRHINRGAPASSLPASTGSLQNWIEPDLQSSDNSVTWRFNKLHQQGIRFAEEGATSVEIFNVAMLALREATQKVVDAKSNAPMTPMLDNLVSSSNQGVNTTNQVNWALVNNSGNQATPGNQRCSNDGRQAGYPNGVMLMQQPVNLALVASGLPSEAGQVSSAINLPNGWAVHGGLDNQQINSAVPVAAQKQQLPDEHSSDGNVSFGSGMSEGRKQKTAEDDMENFITLQDYSEGDSKQDGVATLPQGENIIGMGQTGTNTRSSGNSMNLTLSEAQLAALQAVADAFNVPTVGTTSSSALPIKVLTVPDQFSEGNKGCSVLHDTCCQYFEMLPDQQPLETQKTPSGPNPLVHAAAIAAGARIAPPSVAASLIKAVQSRTTVHVRPGGSSAPVVPVVSGGRGDSLSPLTGVHHNSNIHYFRNREPHPPSTPLLCTGGLAEPGAHQVPLTKECSGLQTSLASAVEQTDLSNVGLEEDPTVIMYHCMDLAEQQT